MSFSVLTVDKLKSGGSTFSIPTTDGDNGNVLVTNGSGILSFADIENYTVVTVNSATYSVQTTDTIIEVIYDGDCSLTLPEISSFSQPVKKYLISRTSETGNVHILASGTDVINAGVFSISSINQGVNVYISAAGQWRCLL